MSHDVFMLCDHKLWRLYNFNTKFDLKHGLLAPKVSLGDPIPNILKMENLDGETHYTVGFVA